MSKDAPSSRLASRSSQNDENDCESGASFNPLHFAPPRTPLNSIPDPSQYQKEIQDSGLGNTTNWSSSDKKVTEVSGSFVSTHGATPRVSVRSQGKIHTEPSSAQSTPARSGNSRVSLGGRGLSSPALFCRGSRGISSVNHEISVDVEHFELVDNPLFWKDHNVQVLIRIRPLSNIEKVSQGYMRCLKQDSAQTLAWLGHPATRFTFDNIACETISQEKLFRVSGLPMVENCLSGYNSCMFAYGQTGSGKTFTMMGEINEVEGKPSADCGITPRIFEYLFSRIRTEEENRKHERLKFSCKCSFLEIYNEQITDLLEPSSTNLQLREDLKKGVYVENLAEYNVTTVYDIVELLIQGAANRKMAATYVNSESSRSHSVFTCIIESQWEKDSMMLFRFARLNLVDLAGSERQKSSGAEGDRLKEAANINKSLSTLGLVIMSLVDLAHGKHRHVPYRDSRLTFLLQDSLGGNSKTTIIANVSPSVCSANETLSTLKFAQRAKLIQNNAKVNENASGDVTALQRQIQQLKDQLSSVMRHHNLLRSPSRNRPIFEESGQEDVIKKNSFPGDILIHNEERNAQNEKTKRLEAMFIGALRREKMAEAVAQKLEAEIEHINRLVCQREEDAQHTKMVLKFRAEKIKQLEASVNGSLCAEKCLLDENKALKEEIQLLQARIDRNPELTRFALENIRLIEQLQLFQNFYEQGERETLLTELAELRDQLLDIVEGEKKVSLMLENQDNDTIKDLEDCRNMNSKLMREVEELRTELRNYGQATSGCAADSFSKDYLEFRKADKSSLVETITMRSDSEDEVTPFFQADDDQNMRSDHILHPSDAEKNLMDARIFIKALESEHVHLYRELQLMQEQNQLFMEILSKKDYVEGQSVLEHESHCLEFDDFEMQNKGTIKKRIGKSFQAKFDKLTQELETARIRNCQYQEDQSSQLSRQHQADLVCEQVEMEASKTILDLQDEVASLQLELGEKLCCMTDENSCLRNTIAAKEKELRALCVEWEKATLELTNFLIDGSRSLRDAAGQIESVVSLFPQLNVEITENVERAAKVCIEKEETILLLQKSLEDAQRMVTEMEEKLSSLKGATIALHEFQHPDNEDSIEDALQLGTTLNENISMVKLLESKLKSEEVQINEAEKRAQASFLVVKWLSEIHEVGLKDDKCFKLASQLLQEHESLKLENEFHILQQIKNELADTNDRLHIVGDVINEKLSVCVLPAKDEDLIDVDRWSADCSTSISDYSTDSAASGNSPDRSSYAHSSMFFPKATQDIVHMNFRGRSPPKHDLEDANNLQKLLKKSVPNADIKLGLRMELEKAFDAFNKVYIQLTTLLYKNDARDNPLIAGMKQGVPSFGPIMETDETGCNSNLEAVASKTINYASSFFSKFVEARETLREADSTLNALLKANENAKQLNETWRQAGQQLLAEKILLGDEVEKLKISLHLKEEENEILLDHLQHNMSEIVNSISELEGCISQLQKEMEVGFKELFSDVLLMGRDVHHFISNSKSKCGDICSAIMERGFEQFVINLCHIGAFVHNNMESGFHLLRHQERYIVRNISPHICVNGQDDILITKEKGAVDMDQDEHVTSLEEGELCLSHSDLLYENLSLKKELERKEVLLQGLLFDFNLLQESASNKKDIKDETEKVFSTFSQVRQELDKKMSQLDDLLLQHEKLVARLTDTETALDLANDTIDTLNEQNADFRLLLKDLYLKNSEAEEQLEEQKEVIEGLEKEIVHQTSEDEKLLSSVKDIANDLRSVTNDRDRLHGEVERIEEELRKVSSERDKLHEEVCSLRDKLDFAYALADENEATAVEARQESEASKSYAEQKEEEVKILETSVEELECTVNVLEKKVYEMNGEVERHNLIRDSLELEIQALRQRLLTVENFSGFVDSESIDAELTDSQLSRQLRDRIMQLHEAQHRIRLLEMEKEEQAEEVKRCKDCISEVVLHSEAQASQYQQKYKTLEGMVREMQTNSSNTTSTELAHDKTEKISTRSRGSSSPFRCIASVVQQMNSEKDQELSALRLRVEELETLAASRQKELCVLNTRLAAAESMTHDVIRDLLCVKLDMTSYADLIDHEHVQKLLVAAHLQTEVLVTKEQIILNLRKRIEDLNEELECCTSTLNQKEADVLATQINVETLKERDQMLSAQNEMLKVDKTNLLKRISELDDIVKTLLSAQNTQEQIRQKQTVKNKESGFIKLGDRGRDPIRRLSQSEKLLHRVNGELAQYLKAGASNSQDKTSLPGLKQKTGSRRLSLV